MLIRQPQRAMPLWVPLLVATALVVSSFGPSWTGYRDDLDALAWNLLRHAPLFAIVCIGFLVERACKGRTLPTVLAAPFGVWLVARMLPALAAICLTVVFVWTRFSFAAPDESTFAVKWLFLYMPAFLAFGAAGNSAIERKFDAKLTRSNFLTLGFFVGVLIASLFWAYGQMRDRRYRLNAPPPVAATATIPAAKVMHLYFPYGICQPGAASKSPLLPGARQGHDLTETTRAMNEFMSNAASGHTVAKVEIVGYADGTGEPRANELLAECRAEAAKKIAVLAGTDRRLISVRGAGGRATAQCSPPVTDPRAEHCRRVDVAVHLQ